jgi:hypothetical protein
MHESDPHSPQFDAKINPEIIADTTAFKLVESFPATIINDARTGRQFYQRLALYREWSGERNILTSFYLDSENTLQLGIFVRPLSEQRYLNDPSRASAAGRTRVRRRTFRSDDEHDSLSPHSSQPSLRLVRSDAHESTSTKETTDNTPDALPEALGHIATAETVERDE